MVYQMHPNHGRHIAYSPQEEQSNIENGWATVTKEEFYGDITEKKEVSRDELIELYTSKFDKKPAHNMKTENIQAKLDE